MVDGWDPTMTLGVEYKRIVFRRSRIEGDDRQLTRQHVLVGRFALHWLG